MTSARNTGIPVAWPWMARRLCVAAASFMIVVSVLAHGVSAGRAERIEGALLSPAVTMGLSAGWGITTYRLLDDPDEFYGHQVGNERIHYYMDHLHLGYGLHMAGFVWKRRFPSSYGRLPYGMRLLFCSGGLIQLDDMYQHLVLHPRDGFDAAESPTGRIAESPIHRLYVAAEQSRRTEEYKLMLDLLVSGRLRLAAGYYQGMAVEGSYRLSDFAQSRGALSVKCIVGTGIVEGDEKKLGIEQVVLGAGLGLFLNRWFSLEAGTGLRVHSANPRLSSPIAFFYGMEFGPRP